MTVHITPAPARTDEPGAASISVRAVRRTGWALAAGATIWSGIYFAFDPQSTDPDVITMVDLFAVPAQLALLALVVVQLRTGATGVTKFARGMLRTEMVLLTLATVWSVLHGAVPAFRDDQWLAILDVFWPLSMLGMFVIGVKIAVAGRWKGLARWWPLGAESWVFITLPAMGIFGVTVGRLVGATHLLIGYAALGVLLALRPHLTGARD
ncbi:hypothetical protein GCM10010112_18690 [Actinoplanes lobatus]|uniref:Uncharacterized protein n=1 Tax=Actinoplanes lobatus TaxID=113568 RepID=A0A7W7H924_9ACTN|nr:hypothetical protein [Actinoplanes lobatus]MBB4746171.1 hypothetical protein [Actinoplanes lobatus]GGN61496.1 hypothetical protein GCM10010112_18690 [Actinoplanes lobatus]GIE41380.1 hypothetical protein Alo02nite_42780 [Actinoplanes lobatus]